MPFSLRYRGSAHQNLPSRPHQSRRVGERSQRKEFFNVTFARTYMDEARNFHDTDSYGRDDPLRRQAGRPVHTFIFERLAEVKAD